MKLLRIKEVIRLTGISKSSVYALSNAGKFPAPIKLSEKSSAWVESEVLDWIQSKIKERKQVNGGLNVTQQQQGVPHE